MIPHIVRESILTDENTRAIYTGTSQAVELIRKEPSKMLAADGRALAAPPALANAQTTSAANAAQSMIGRMAADAKQLPPGGRMPLTTPGAGQPVMLAVVPAAANQAVGATFQVAVTAANAHDLYSVPLQMQFDPRVLQLVNVDAGELLSQDGLAVALVHRDEGNGGVTISATRPPGAKGVDGQGTICTLTFKAIAAGDSTLALTRIGAKDSQQVSVVTMGNQGVVHVK